MTTRLSPARVSPALLLALILALCAALIPVTGHAATIKDFVGAYEGEAEVIVDGAPLKRDMSVTIAPTKEGFTLSWTSATHREDGRIKEKTYSIGFVPSARDNIYQSAMKTNLFGKATPLDGKPVEHPLDLRIPLAKWLTSKQNEFFSQNVVNRYV